MIYEVQRGRECSVTLTVSLERITALENLNQSQAQLIELRGSEVARLKELDHNWTLRLDNQAELYLLDKSKLKAKIRKRNKIIALESWAIVMLLVLLL